MSLGSAVHQTLGQPGCKADGQGEAKPDALGDEARPARQGIEGSGEMACSRRRSRARIW